MSRQARLLALFNVRPDESRLVVWTLGFALLLNGAGVLTRTAAYALFLQEFSGDDLPYTYICLLYTSDAADERSSVDLGGRRIIKKKKLTLVVLVTMYDKR